MQTRSLTFQIAFKCIKVQAKEERTSWAALFDACSAWEVLRAAVSCQDTSAVLSMHALQTL